MARGGRNHIFYEAPLLLFEATAGPLIRMEASLNDPRPTAHLRHLLSALDRLVAYSGRRGDLKPWTSWPYARGLVESIHQSLKLRHRRFQKGAVALFQASTLN